MKTNTLKIGALLSLLFVPFLLLSVNAQWGNQYPNNGVSRFRWEGVVDGTSTVRIRGRQVNVETYSGLPVQRQQYNFSDPLPRTALNVELVVLDGRDRIRLIDEPRAGNDYTAVVRIDDRSGGRDLYRFELRWNDRNQQDNGGGWNGGSQRNSDYVTWRGRVDGESIIRVYGNQVREETIYGGGVFNTRHQFSAPLPNRQVNVNLLNTEGRGQIVIVEQPSRYNNYTATVRITDRQGGSSNYGFTLAWEKQNYRDVDHDRWIEPRDRFGRGVSWQGRVDGRDLIYIRGNQLWVDHRDGQAIRETDFRFFRPLPNRQTSVTVRKISGRGSVRLLEQPSPYNNYTAVIQIEDRDGGSDRYQLEIDW
ncbi:MAG TPA: hypothetical protein PLD20_15230 [Blastocatellia bacterium]|nr:hypothetical protein [Blastocatellia bacterium]HMV87438.1 hypothetical protein [Blastocatellia bacterium]HMX27665.1 hypothetical protein [Blastocatellia bacterium]HMY75218.1 hypothetical protein [Blastocatellia bacterium]HMZ19287.1 hypothetical protein [Blastocatellia bacterium]